MNILKKVKDFIKKIFNKDRSVKVESIEADSIKASGISNNYLNNIEDTKNNYKTNTDNERFKIDYINSVEEKNEPADIEVDNYADLQKKFEEKSCDIEQTEEIEEEIHNEIIVEDKLDSESIISEYASLKKDKIKVWKENEQDYKEIKDNSFEIIHKDTIVDDIGRDITNGTTVKNEISCDSITNLKEQIKEKDIEDKKSEDLIVDLKTNEVLCKIKKDNKLSVANIFAENKYNLIRNYCVSKKVEYINELTNELFLEFCTIPGAGTKKISDLRAILIDFWKVNRNTYIFNYNIYKVEFVFSEYQFEKFREFCKKNNVTYLKEIDVDLLNRLKNEKNVTNTMINKIKDKLITYKDLLSGDNYIENSNEDKIREKDRVVVFNEYWFDILKDAYISDIIKEVYDKRIECSAKISDINNKTISEINYIDSEFLVKTVSKVNNILPLHEIVKESVNKLADSRLEEIIIKRYINKYTLEEIGKNLNITRERVRQLQKKAEEKIYRYLKSNNFDIAIRLKYLNNNHCLCEEFEKIFIENEIIMYLILENQWFDIKRIDELDRIAIRNDVIDLKKTVTSIINNLPSTFKLSEHLKEIKVELKTANIMHANLNDIDDLLIKNKYRKYGKYYSKEKLTVIAVCNILFEEYIDMPLKLDDNGCEFIRKVAKEILDFDFNESNRSIEARIRDCREILLVDRMTFLHINKVNVNKEILEEIRNILNKELSDKQIVNVEYIFSMKMNKWIANGILSKYTMYSLINFYFGDEFVVGKGNSLDIYLNDEYISLSREERLIGILEQNNGRMMKNELLQKLGWKAFKLDDTICKSDKIERKNNEIILK